MSYEVIEYTSTIAPYRRYLTILYQESVTSNSITSITRYSTDTYTAPLQVRHLSWAEASKYFRALDKSLTKRGYVLSNTTADSTTIAMTPSQVEEHYQESARTTVRSSFPLLPLNKMVAWVIRSGVFYSARTSRADRHVLDIPDNYPHASDKARDLILMPRAELCGPKYDEDTVYLGHRPSNPSTALLNSILTLYYPGHPAPNMLFSTAHTLVHAC